MELIFTNSYLGVMKWQSLVYFLSIAFAIYKRDTLILIFIIFAFHLTRYIQTELPDEKLQLLFYLMLGSMGYGSSNLDFLIGAYLNWKDCF